MALTPSLPIHCSALLSLSRREEKKSGERAQHRSCSQGLTRSWWSSSRSFRSCLRRRSALMACVVARCALPTWRRVLLCADLPLTEESFRMTVVNWRAPDKYAQANKLVRERIYHGMDTYLK